MEGAAAPITDGSTVVADTGHAVAARQRHASVEARLCIRTAAGIRNLWRVHGRIRHSRINDSCLGRDRIDRRVRACGGVGARVHAAIRPGCEINDSCLGKARLDLRARAGVCARVFLARHAGFETIDGRVVWGPRSAGVHWTVAQIGSDRVRNHRGAIRVVAGSDPQSVPATPKQASHRRQAAQVTNLGVPTTLHAHKFNLILFFRVPFTRARNLLRSSRNRNSKLPLAPGARAR
jgi:hypothetical protein